MAARRPRVSAQAMMALEDVFSELLASARAIVLANLKAAAVHGLVAAGPEGDPGLPAFVPNPDAVFDLQAWVELVQTTAGPAVLNLLVDAANRAAIGVSFELDDPRMAAAVERHVAGIESWGAKLQADVALVVRDGVAQGWSIDTMVAELGEKASLGEKRARAIARTEAISASNAGTIEGWRATGVVTGKRWISTHDDRTRDTHVEADGQTVGLDGRFTVGGAPCDYPGDPNLPLEERVNCRCTLGAVTDDLPGLFTIGSFQAKSGRGKGSRDQRGRFAPPGKGGGGAIGKAPKRALPGVNLGTPLADIAAQATVNKKAPPAGIEAKIAVRSGPAGAVLEKTYKRDAKKMRTAELLASDVGEALGTPIPRVIEGRSPDKVIQDFVPDSSSHVDPDAISRQMMKDARELALFDYVTANTDRHAGNLVATGYDYGSDTYVKPRLIGVDHSHAFEDGPADAPLTSNYSEIVSYAIVIGPGPGRPVNGLYLQGEVLRHPFGAADLKKRRARVEALRPKFEAAGRGDAVDAMMRRFDSLIETATKP